MKGKSGASIAADRAFLSAVADLLGRVHFTVEVRSVGEDSLDVELHVQKVGLRFVEVTQRRQRHEVESDPRGFGDADDVVARAMEHYRPGAVNSWTEVSRTVTVMGWNLPDPEMPQYQAVFTYDPSYTYEHSDGYRLERILVRIREVVSNQSRSEHERDTDLLVGRMKGLFASIK